MMSIINVGKRYQGTVVIGAVRWSVVVHLGKEEARIYRDGKRRCLATWEPLATGCTIIPSPFAEQTLPPPPLVLQQLERELWAELQDQ